MVLAGAISLALALGLLVEMGREIAREIDALATANSDNTQWSLAQTDVELLALDDAIDVALVVDDAEVDADTLRQVRSRFDIFYSRVSILRSSPIFASVREDPVAVEALSRIEAFLAETIPLIDADDAGLRAALPLLEARTEAIRPDVRTVTLQGVAALAREADDQRTGVASTLSLVSKITAALFFVMVVLVALLAHFVRKERTRAYQEGRTRARLASIISTSLDAIVVADQEGRVLEFNPAAEKIFGYARDEAMGARMEDLIVPEHHREAHVAGMKRYQATGERHVIGKGRVQLEARRKSGDIFPVELSISSAETRKGEVFISYARDISHQVAAERELIKARDEAVAGEKAKADLIAVMSHEMRTPLNGMLGTLDLLDTGERPPKEREYLDIIRASGRQLLYHVDTVLEISRAEAGKIVLAEEPFSLPALVRELVESQRGVAEHRGNALSYLVETGGTDHVLGDPTRVRQVLLNLLGNAIKFTRNGAIAVEAERLDDSEMIEFRVIDDGIGIDAADLDRVFEDFVTLDTSYTRSVGGTGLGLGIVRRLVKAMGGQIGVESTKGEGSLFRVRLPLPSIVRSATPSDRPETAADGVSEAAVVAPMKVLIVEDNRINRIVLRDLLEQDGHAVDEAHDGQQGVDMAARTSYDIVLMDISMPVLDGVAATRAIRADEARGTRLPIVALTAHAAAVDKERFRAAGVDDILVKPISRQGLRAVLAGFSHKGMRTGAPAAATPAVLDRAQLDDLGSALGAGKLAELLAAFRAEMTDAVETITSRLARGEVDFGLADAVHHAAGSAAMFGATALRGELVALEELIRRGDQPDPATGPGLRATWTSTEAALTGSAERG
ncbi:PAS domain S-box protein [Rhodobacterales bacterium HKCCSP123]|nr:PAS domain S-box protein [Rhodobacterales bacterium HKCCSP123]